MSAPMMTTTTWNVAIRIDEDPDSTKAVAMMSIGGRELRGVGQARRNPVDRPVVLIGEEMACARALSSLAHELMEYAAGEVEKNVRRGDPNI